MNDKEKLIEEANKIVRECIESIEEANNDLDSFEKAYAEDTSLNLSRMQFKSYCFDLLDDYSIAIKKMRPVITLLKDLEYQIFGEQEDEG